jgi:hypothetical protein
MDDHDLLVRIDERTSTLHVSMAEMRQSLGGYVTQKEFKPVRYITFGLVGAICLAVLGAVTSLIIKM